MNIKYSYIVRYSLVFCAFVLAFTSVGCRNHKVTLCGKSYPKKDLSTIKCASKHLNILKVDGEELSSDSFHRGARTVRVIPGSHKITVEYFKRRGFGARYTKPHDLNIVTEKGKLYYLRCKKTLPISGSTSKDEFIEFTIEDSTTGNESLLMNNPNNNDSPPAAPQYENIFPQKDKKNIFSFDKQ